MKKLTAKEEAFCQNYIISNNGSDAARKAGYSELAAKETSYDLLTKSHIQERLSELRKPIQEKWEVDKEYIVTSFKKIAEDYLADEKKDKGRSNAAVQALDKLAKIIGAYEADNEQKKMVIEIERQ